MSNKQVESLREALKISPDNIPLRVHLAETLLNFNELDEAELEFHQIVALGEVFDGSFGLARIFYIKEEYQKCMVVLEQLLESHRYDREVLILYCRALVKEDELDDATQIYQEILELDPNFSDEDLDQHLKQGIAKSNGVLMIPSPFMGQPEMDFDDVGGMQSVKKEIELKIIKPLQHPELYQAYGKKIGGGILLYGPPGCGKTYIAKATAGQVNARFINISLNDILDMWIGNSEKNLHAVFEMARGNTPCVLFFDEIDALGASRTDMKQSSGRHLINQFLQELDGMSSDNEGMLVLGATNTPWHLDAAFRRPGRFDRIIFVPPPDEVAREEIFKLKLKGKPVSDISYAGLVKKSVDFSGADIETIIDLAVEDKLTDSFADGIPKPISTKDLANAIKRHSASTKEWFSTARNFALYSNESGLYDPILKYLNIKK